MNAALGQGAVLLGLLSALFGIFALVFGIVRNRPALTRSSRVYVWLIVTAAVLAVVAMERALITRDFSLAYVAAHGSHSTPPLYNFATLWSALEGSILLWALVLAGYLAAMSYKFRHKAGDPLFGWAMVAGLVVAAFFFALMMGPANPFETLPPPFAADGPGPNPLLQNHPLMAVHPPMLYLGYVGFTVPFALCIGALVTGRVDEGWLGGVRRWALFAWLFLTSGILLGAWWSYEVLGWGGFWAWDPVENASLLPWLTGTAFLHSVMVQERRGMLRVWNISLLVATFSLTILGTFLTRSGVLDSVHSFTESPIGVWILAFFGVVVATSLGLIAWRGDELRSPGTITKLVSRESSFLANNILFAAFAFVVLLGTVFPLVIEAVNGDRIAVGRPYFDRMTMPIGFCLLFLMAVAPVLPWKSTSTELLRDRLQWPAWFATAVVVVCVSAGVRGLPPLLAFALAAFAGAVALRRLILSARRDKFRAFRGRTNGGMVVHMGVAVIAVALAASQSYETRRELRLDEGESATVAGHEFTYLNASRVRYGNRTALRADVRIDGKDVYQPALNKFPFFGQTIGTPSVRSSWNKDIYLTFVAAPTSENGPAVIGVAIFPMVYWLWIGGGVMFIGTVLAMLPEKRRPIPASSRSENAE